ncbi:MAG: 3-deoxy-8-phosphooctulonate synthase, partial [Thermodesulfovibrionia bacterium]|nr:3-deoxy-8-phosphooctulonate synthase [Thermodesulfovibrionia bacterium]
RILQKVKDDFGYKIVTDVHESIQVPTVAEVVDMLQIPAFLCRQTDLLVACAKTDKEVNIKKGQFLAPWDVKNIIEKFSAKGNHSIVITERGTSFGYNNLVVDMRAFPIVQSFGYPVVFDATHSVQLPGGRGNASSGNREYVAPLARAAAAAGCDAVFLEVHESPDKALCDGPNSLDLEKIAPLAREIEEISKIARNRAG